MTIRILAVAALALGITLVFSGAVSAAIIAYDPFDWSAAGPPADYSADTDGDITSSAAGRITGSVAQNPTVPGFTGAWKGTDTALWKVKQTGLTNPNSAISTSGGLAQSGVWNAAGSYDRMRSRDLSAPPTVASGDTYYMSGLVQARSVAQGGSDFGWAGFVDYSSNGNSYTTGDRNAAGWRVGFQATNAGSNFDLVFQHRNTSGVGVTEVLQSGVNPQETFFVLVRGTDEGGTGTNDKVEVWVNPGYVLSDAALDLITPDYTGDDWSLNAANPFQLFALQGKTTGSNASPRDLQFDEFRLTSSLYQAMGVIPEPTTLLVWSLLAGLGVGIGWRRRR